MSNSAPRPSAAESAVPPAARPRRAGPRWFAAAMLAALVGSIALWYATRDRLPPVVRFATSPEGGLYHKVGEWLQPALEARLGRPVRLVRTNGSVDNREKLLTGEADLALLQDGAIDPQGVAVVAPLYHDVVHVLVRADLEIEAIEDLRGRRVALGPRGSGMRESALVVLRHYGLTPDDLHDNERYFGELVDGALEGAIVTTGYLNQDLTRVMATGHYRLLPLPHAEALAIHHPYLVPRTIPAGVFEGQPPIPESPIPTVSTTAYLGVRAGASPQLVRRTLAALYEQDLRHEIPTLIPLTEARRTTLGHLHPASQNYYDPFAGVDVLSNLLESLSAVKELLFALLAGVYLAWDRWKRVRDRREQAALAVLKERLDQFLEETVRLERAQMETDDPRQLREHLDAVTRVKLRAIQELTHEDLRGDRLFSIFLLQCSDLAVKIQSKLANVERSII